MFKFPINLISCLQVLSLLAAGKWWVEDDFVVEYRKAVTDRASIRDLNAYIKWAAYCFNFQDPEDSTIALLSGNLIAVYTAYFPARHFKCDMLHIYSV